MNDSIILTPRSQRLKTGIVLVLGVLLFVVSTSYLQLDVATFMERSATAGDVVKNFLVIDTQDLGEILTQLLVSIAMAIVSLLIGTVISFILAIFGAHNIAPNAFLSGLIKAFVSIVRGVPSLVWILMIVASLGFGTLPGVMGLVFPTVGYLTKSFISSIEEVSVDVIETMKTTGASWFQLIVEGILPNVWLSFTTWIAIRLEANVAESISLGMVGAGGIGTVLSRAISSYNYGKITMCILCIFLTMVIFELSMSQMKKKQVVG